MTEDVKSSAGSPHSNNTPPSTSNCRAMNEAPTTTGTMQPHSAAETIQPPGVIPQMTGVGVGPPVARCRLNPKDFANSDFVNRLVAATRITDFYSANIAPHSFFYSEMLRSLVQARNESESQQAAAAAASFNSSMSNFPLSQRRNRKRSWPAHRIGDLRSPAAAVGGGGPGNPLPGHPFNVGNLAANELKLEKIRKKEEKEAIGYGEITAPAEETEIKGKSPVPLAQDKPPLVIPSTQQQPSWYPPSSSSSLYPYGIDPLHFFIDLRVSGQIYDNNNEGKGKGGLQPPSPSSSVAGLDQKVRHGSAFSVPPSSRNLGSLMAPMNLTTGQSENLQAGGGLFMSDKGQTLFKERYLDSNNNQQQQSEDYHEEHKQRMMMGNNNKFSAEEVIAVVDDNDSH